jgi:hypothetical protein
MSLTAGRGSVNETRVEMSTANPSQLERLEGAAARIEAQRAAVVRGAPWPTGSLARGEGEERWGPTEVLAHVAEMLPFWLGEMERVLDGAPGDAAPFGRTVADQVRTLTIARDATLPPRELFDRIGAGVERYRRRLPALSAADLDRVGRHPTRGDLTVTELLERFVVAHMEDHANQLEATLTEATTG